MSNEPQSNNNKSFFSLMTPILVTLVLSALIPLIVIHHYAKTHDLYNHDIQIEFADSLSIEQETAIKEIVEDAINREKTIDIDGSMRVLDSSFKLMAVVISTLTIVASILTLIGFANTIRWDKMHQKAKEDIDTTRNEMKEEMETAKTEMGTAKTEMETAKTEMETAKTEMETAKTEMETAKTEMETAKTEMETAKTEMESAKEDIDKQKQAIDTAKAEVDEQKAEITRIKEDMKNDKNLIEETVNFTKSYQNSLKTNYEKTRKLAKSYINEIFSYVEDMSEQNLPREIVDTLYVFQRMHQVFDESETEENRLFDDELFALGVANSLKKDYEEAKTVFRNIAEKKIDSLVIRPNTWYDNKYVCKLTLSKLSGSIINYIKKRGRDMNANQQEELFIEAEKHLDRAIDIDQNFVAAHYNKGVLYKRKANTTNNVKFYKESMRCFKKSQQLYTEHVESYDMEAIALMEKANLEYKDNEVLRKEEYVNAVKTLYRGITIDPNHKKAVNNMSFITAQFFKSEEMLFDFKEGKSFRELAFYYLDRTVELRPSYSYKRLLLTDPFLRDFLQDIRNKNIEYTKYKWIHDYRPPKTSK